MKMSKFSKSIWRILIATEFAVAAGRSAQGQKAPAEQVSTGSQSTSVKKLLFSEVFSTVIDSNGDIKTSAEQLQQATDRVDQAKKHFLPTVSASATYLRQDVGDQSGSVASTPGASIQPIGGSSISQAESKTVQATLKQNLYSGSQDIARLNEKRNARRKAKADFSSTKLTQRLSTVKSIFQIIAYQSDIKNYRDQEELLLRRERDIGKAVAARRVKLSDLVNLRASLLTTKSNLTSSLTDLETEWLNLEKTAGRQLDRGEVIFDQDHLIKVDQLTGDLVVDHPDVRSAEADISVAEAQLKENDSQLLPTIDLTGNYYFLRPDVQKDIHWDAQITFSVPWPGLEKHAQSAEYRKEINIKKIGLERARARVLNDVEALRRAYRNDANRERILSESVKSNHQLVELQRRDYESGLASLNDVLLAMTNLQQAVLSLDHLKIQQVQRLRQLVEYHEAKQSERE